MVPILWHGSFNSGPTPIVEKFHKTNINSDSYLEWHGSFKSGPSCSSHLIDSWIVFLSRNGIKKLILMLDLKEDRYDVPSSIFNCQELCHLELFNCRLSTSNI